MYILSGEGPQILYHPYDHPYFGQIFLAAMLKAIAYPDSLNPSEDGTGRTTETRHYMYSVKMLYLLPRILVGVLAVIDTFLLYKITERQYESKNVALIASIIFAIMPMSWFLRRTWLDSLMLPMLLFSILSALYIKGPHHIQYSQK